MVKTFAIFLTLLVLGIFPSMSVAVGQVNCFIYHRFDNFRYPSTDISAEVFQAQLKYLKTQNLTALSLGEIARRLQAGETLPVRGVALSVDDAFTSFAEVAMPILRKAGLPVTLFVNTDAVGSPGYLNWEQLKMLHEEGIEIGNHSATHDYLVELKAGEDYSRWRERVRNDILRAQTDFEQHLGIRPKIFAYPYGEYVPELLDLIKELGFKAAFGQQSGVIYAGSNRFFLPRFPMGGPYATLEGFKSKLAMKPVAVEEEVPSSPLLGDSNPPELQVKIVDPSEDLRRINCYVQGDNTCQVEQVDSRPGWYTVKAVHPLEGRRNKYTLTVQGKKGGWYWYSHLWLNAVSPANSGKQAQEKN